MKRWPPYGTQDGTDWTNGNPATGTRGSVIDARAIDHAQAEIVNAISRLGLTPDKDDLEQLGKAIQNAIAAATGGGETEDFLTMATARARLPVYPEILTADAKLAVTSPSSGTLFVPAAGTIRHRGVYDVLISDYTDVERTFNLLPSKVAHLRWSAASGLERFYLDDAGYNPSGLPETDVTFDSTYDSALLARVVTDASAVATVTNLVNVDRFEELFEVRLTPGDSDVDTSGNAVSELVGTEGLSKKTYDINLARRPQAMFSGCGDATVQTPTSGSFYINLVTRAPSRYKAEVMYQRNSLPGGAWMAMTVIL